MSETEEFRPEQDISQGSIEQSVVPIPNETLDEVEQAAKAREMAEKRLAELEEQGHVDDKPRSTGGPAPRIEGSTSE